MLRVRLALLALSWPFLTLRVYWLLRKPAKACGLFWSFPWLLGL